MSNLGRELEERKLDMSDMKSVLENRYWKELVRNEEDPVSSPFENPA